MLHFYHVSCLYRFKTRNFKQFYDDLDLKYNTLFPIANSILVIIHVLPNNIKPKMWTPGQAEWRTLDDA